jgi:hypothetical protein
MSDPAVGLPAWIQLDWPEPISPTRLQLVFDTGMHRVLTFSLADAYTQTMHWGRPQPESVRDYIVETQHRGLWQLVQDIAENYQRCNTIALDGKSIDALRVTIRATNGLDHARICHIGVR